MFKSFAKTLKESITSLSIGTPFSIFSLTLLCSRSPGTKISLKPGLSGNFLVY